MTDSERSAALEGIVSALRRFATDMTDAGRSIATSPFASTGIGEVFERCAPTIADISNGVTLDLASMEPALAALESAQREIDDAGVQLDDTLARSIAALAALIADIKG